EVPISEMNYHDIWGSYLRYIGAGAVAFGGIIGLVKTLPTILSSFTGALKGFKNTGNAEELRTDKDISMLFIVLLTIAFIATLMFLSNIEIGIIGVILIFIFVIFVVTVSSRIIGIVESYSHPVSGIAIAAIILITNVVVGVGQTGE